MTMTDVSRALTDLSDWLEEDSAIFSEVQQDSDTTLSQISQLTKLGERMRAPLFVLLCGGTGAGKSTLLNAIAGAEIARASAVRPTTTRFTVYLHRSKQLFVPREVLKQPTSTAIIFRQAELDG